jgi:hypothetical protein
MLGWWLLLLAIVAATMAIVSRHDTKILYMNGDRLLHDARWEMTLYEFDRAIANVSRAQGAARSPNRLARVGAREYVLMARHGALLVQCFEYSASRSAPTISWPKGEPSVKGALQKLEEMAAFLATQPARLLNVREFELPLIWLAVGMLAFSALLLLPPPIRRALRRARNRCVYCGYLLRGLTSSRCPECGHPFLAKAGALTGT